MENGLADDRVSERAELLRSLFSPLNLDEYLAKLRRDAAGRVRDAGAKSLQAWSSDRGLAKLVARHTPSVPILNHSRVSLQIRGQRVHFFIPFRGCATLFKTCPTTKPSTAPPKGATVGDLLVVSSEKGSPAEIEATFDSVLKEIGLWLSAIGAQVVGFRESLSKELRKQITDCLTRTREEIEMASSLRCALSLSSRTPRARPSRASEEQVLSPRGQQAWSAFLRAVTKPGWTRIVFAALVALFAYLIYDGRLSSNEWSVLLGIVASFVAWFLVSHLWVPSIRVSGNIQRVIDGNDERYRIKLWNDGRREVVQLNLRARVAIFGLLQGNTWQYVWLRMSAGQEEYSFPLLGGRSNVLPRIHVESEVLKGSQFSTGLRQKYQDGALQLEELLLEGERAFLTFYISGVDSFSGAPVFRRSRPYTIEDITYQRSHHAWVDPPRQRASKWVLRRTARMLSTVKRRVAGGTSKKQELTAPEASANNSADL